MVTFSSEFNITVIDRSRRENLVAKFLSRMNISQNPASVLDDFLDDNLFSISTHTPWFIDVANYLVSGKLPQNLYARGKHRVVQLSDNYSWIEGDLYCTGPYVIMRRYVLEDEMYDVLKACRSEPCVGIFFFFDKRIYYKVLHVGYYWPTLFKDAKKFVTSYDACQRMGRPV